MADIIRQVDAFTDYERDLTFNVGTVAGGTVINRVPHFATASVEMRAFAPDVYQDGIARMMALNGISSVSSVNGDFPCQVEVEITRKTAPWPRNEGTDRLFAVWREAADSLGFRVVPEERGGLSDGNYFWDRIPTIDGLGAAGGNAHCSERSPDGSKDQEYCLPASFVPKALLNVAAVLKLVQKQTSIEQE
jgi:glutamate carboxypeptidase